VYALVAAGAGVALVPGLAGPPPPGVRPPPPPPPPLTRRIAAATRSGAAEHPGTRALLDALAHASQSASAEPVRPDAGKGTGTIAATPATPAF
jgi:DNA-binding transcriptional LysR family regulator